MAASSFSTLLLALAALTALALLPHPARADCPSSMSCPFNSCNPCHPGSARTKSDCQLVRLPAGMCGACKLKDPKPSGIFQDATQIYDISRAKCVRKLKNYARWNKCDSARMTVDSIKAAVNGNKEQRLKIDYMLYTVCEECCDCVPKFVSANDVGALSVVRGNCPGHAVFDICSIYPKVKWFIKGNKKPGPNLNNLPLACNELNAWKNSPAFAGWAGSNNVNINQKVKNFLQSLLDAAVCHRPNIWNRCFDLENRQGRV